MIKIFGDCVAGGVLFGAFSLVFCIIFCIFRSKEANVRSLSLKTIASLCFILCAMHSILLNGSSLSGLLILAGLIMGLIGDIALDLKVMYPQQGGSYFIFGTSAFIIGHIFYFAAILSNSALSSSNLIWRVLASVGAAIMLSALVLSSSKKMGMNFGKMFPLVALYSFFLIFMTAFSVATAIFSAAFWIFAAGMIMFLLSDLLLSMQYFGGRDEKVFIYIDHILYYGAQVMIAFFTCLTGASI